MGGGKNAVLAILALAGGIGLGYFWTTSRPQDGLEIVAGVSIISVALLYFALLSIGKH